jgi:hypothetical protein
MATDPVMHFGEVFQDNIIPSAPYFNGVKNENPNPNPEIIFGNHTDSQLAIAGHAEIDNEDVLKQD